MRMLWKRVLLGVVILLVAIPAGFVGWASFPLGPGTGGFSRFAARFKLYRWRQYKGWARFSSCIGVEVAYRFYFLPGWAGRLPLVCAHSQITGSAGFFSRAGPHAALAGLLYAPDKADRVLTCISRNSILGSRVGAHLGVPWQPATLFHPSRENSGAGFMGVLSGRHRLSGESKTCDTFHFWQ